MKQNKVAYNGDISRGSTAAERNGRFDASRSVAASAVLTSSAIPVLSVLLVVLVLLVSVGT